MSAAPNLTFDDSEIRELVSRLRDTYRVGRTRSRSWRDRQLGNLLRLLRECETELLDAMQADLGKCHYEGWIAEVQVLVKEIEHARKHLPLWMDTERAPTPLPLMPASSRIVKEPLGVVLIIGAWNYPLQLSLLPLVSAIAGGNAAIVKPSEVSPETSTVLARLIPRYLDTDAIAVVEGGVPETTALLEQRFDHIFYTGNGRVGRIVMTAAARHLTPVTLELGGKSPCIVDRSCDLEVTARRVVWAKTFNAGQTCVAPDYVLVDRAVHGRFLELVGRTIEDFFGKNPKDSDDLARIVNERHFDRLMGLIDGQKVLFGGDSDRDSRYIAPTVLDDPAPDSPVMSDEIFGPILPVIPYDDIDAAIGFINDRPKPLALYIFAESDAVCDRVLERTSSGGACINDCMTHLAVPDLPFGGVGESGMGAYHGKEGFDTFTHKKSVFNKSRHLDLPVRYPPYSDRKVRWARRLI